MFNVCPQCGQYSVEKSIDPRGPYAICPFCSHAHRFLHLPLFALTGASGSGKTAVCLELSRTLSECVCLESDILWCSELASPEDDYRSYRDLWLRMCKNISQAGRPVLLCGSATPDQFESCPERRYLGEIHHLALVCDDDTLVRRLEERPSWRNSSAPQFIQDMRAFNQWFKDHAALTDPPIALLDTSHATLCETACQVRGWVLSHLAEGQATRRPA